MPTVGGLSPISQKEVDAAVALSVQWVDQWVAEVTSAVLRCCEVPTDAAYAIVLAVQQPVDDYRMHEHLRGNRLTPARMATQVRTTAEFIRETVRRVEYMDPMVREHAIRLGWTTLGEDLTPQAAQLNRLAAVLMKVADRVEALAASGRPKKVGRDKLLALTMEALSHHLPGQRKAQRVAIARQLFQAWHIELPDDDNKLRKAVAQGKRTKTPG